MRVGIDAHILGKGKGGVETVLLGIIRSLAQLDFTNEYLIYVSRRHPFRAGELPSNFRLCPLPVANPWIQRPLVIPFLYARDRLDVIHLQRVMPFWGCQRCVLHIHDALYETHPQFFSPLKRRIFSAISRRSATRATRIVTVTEHARREISAVFGVPAERIDVISNGLDSVSFHAAVGAESLDRILQRCAVTRPYVIVLGMLERHKNTDIALRAFERFSAAHPAFTLLVVGRRRTETRRGYADELQELAASLCAAPKIKFQGYVSDEDRLALLNGASMLVFPATAEGFGLPPIEAMACGVPVIAADTPVAREVYADAVMLSRPLDPADLAAQMDQLAADHQIRTVLVARGLTHAAKYSWRNVAYKLIKIYEQVSQCRSAAP